MLQTTYIHHAYTIDQTAWHDMFAVDVVVDTLTSIHTIFSSNLSNTITM